jgi:hypothetical protein
VLSLPSGSFQRSFSVSSSPAAAFVGVRSVYGAADWIVALSGDASRRVPVRLDPRPE